jgi:hypothetical protein
MDREGTGNICMEFANGTPVSISVCGRGKGTRLKYSFHVLCEKRIIEFSGEESIAGLEVIRELYRTEEENSIGGLTSIPMPDPFLY